METTHDQPSIDALAQYAASYATDSQGRTAPAPDGITVRFTSWITDEGNRRTNVTAEHAGRELAYLALTPGEQDEATIRAALVRVAAHAALLSTQPTVRSSTTALRACAAILLASSSASGQPYELDPLVRAAHAAGVGRDDLVTLMRSGYEASRQSRGWDVEGPARVAALAVDRALSAELDAGQIENDPLAAGELVLAYGTDRLGGPDASHGGTALDLVLLRSREAADLARAQETAVQARDEALRAASAAGVRAVELVEATGLTKGRISQILKG